MSVIVNDYSTYESGSGGYLATHAFPDIDAAVADPYVAAFGIERTESDVDGFTIEGVAPTVIQKNISGDATAGVDVRGRIENNAATSVVIDTSTFKLMAGIAAAFGGVDQSNPVVGTPVAASDYGAAATASYTGTAGNMLVVCASTQDDRTSTPSNCTEIDQVTHADANLGSAFMGYVEATGSPQTIGATFTGDTNWRLVIFELKAAAAAPASVTKVKVGGSFIEAIAKAKVGGTFVEVTPKFKSGGSF